VKSPFVSRLSQCRHSCAGISEVDPPDRENDMATEVHAAILHALVLRTSRCFAPLNLYSQNRLRSVGCAFGLFQTIGSTHYFRPPRTYKYLRKFVFRENVVFLDWLSSETGTAQYLQVICAIWRTLIVQTVCANPHGKRSPYLLYHFPGVRCSTESHAPR
jgi:hypothetical protein